MKYTDLKNSIEKGALPIYLLEGEDAYFRMKGEEQIKNAFLEMPELNFTSFDGENLKGGAIAELVNAVKNYPFMAEKRIVRVSEFYPTESEYEQYLKELFSDFPPTAVLIINNSQSKKGADLKRKNSVSFFDCSHADADTVTRWIYVTLNRAKITASVALCESIAEYCLCNMTRVAVEVQKLIDYKQQGELTKEEVDELVYKDTDYRIYELTNAISRKDYGKFCRIMEELQNKGVDEIYLLSGLFNYFKNLLTVLSSKESDSELSKLLNMKEYGVKKSREQAFLLGEKRLTIYVNYLYNLIADVKSGRITPESALQSAQNSIFFASGAN